MKIYVCPCEDKKKSITVLPSVIDALVKYRVVPVMSDALRTVYNDERVTYCARHDTDEDIIAGLQNCDMIMTVGGDGMMLRFGKAAAEYSLPLIGINTGRLGFMTTIDTDELEKLSALSDGSYTISKRMLLGMKQSADAEKDADDLTENGYTRCAINDIVLFKNVDSKLPEFIVRINGETVTRIRADGLIFSTPTGSTAYALSAGGPIIEPSIECIQMTPLCPHSLLNRPMIFSGNDKITVSYAAYERSRVNISADGGESYKLPPEKEIVIFKSDVQLNIVQIGGKSFYRTVSEKLMTTLK